MLTVTRSWDLFCHVIDNFGDAAVCWRLARSLANEVAPGSLVRLWIDDLGALHALVPEIAKDRPCQSHAAVEIHHWVANADFGSAADVVVEAFGGGIPEAYAAAMAARRPSSLWIVLEYLSAEPWVASRHGLPSPHPRLSLERYFFFPGFGAETGGLLREVGLAARQESFLRQPAGEFWRNAGFAPPGPDSTPISLFGYENPALSELLGAWSCGKRAVVAAVPLSRLGAGVAAWLGPGFEGAEQSWPCRTAIRDALELRFLPFLAQDRYDELLWSSDWNFVRGEDSFVRAQWAGRPFVWQAYPQKENAHLAKVNAFLDLYCKDLPPAIAENLRTFWRAWNDPPAAGAIGRAWRALTELSPAELEALRRHARNWGSEAGRSEDLAAKLAKFCAERLK